MYLVALCLFVLKLTPSSTFLFPSHMDLQKVGETIFNNEKYNILKPTTHKISDYFKDFMLRRENIEFPSSRVFLDSNGFRHYWSGFEKKSNSLRKTDLVSDAFETVADNKENKTAINKTNNSTETDSSSSEKGNSTEVRAQSEKSKNQNKKADTSSSSAESTSNVSEEKDNTAKNKKQKAKSTKHSNGNDIKVIKHRKKDIFESKETAVSSDDIHLRGGEPAATSDKTRTVAKTTFFCPYFGVITMSAFLD